jgi:hypothetical protein
MIPVAIEKGEKHPKRSRLITRILQKFRVPAALSFGSMITGPLLPPMFDQDEEQEAEIEPAF